MEAILVWKYGSSVRDTDPQLSDIVLCVQPSTLVDDLQTMSRIPDRPRWGYPTNRKGVGGGTEERGDERPYL